MPQPTWKGFTSAVDSSFLDNILIMNIPNAAAANRKIVSNTISKTGETAADCCRIENLARKIADRGMPIMATVPRIRLQPAKGWSLKTFLMCLHPDAFKLVMDDTCGEEQ